jgi:exopolysaccharide production protein ExoQ
VIAIGDIQIGTSDKSTGGGRLAVILSLISFTLLFALALLTPFIEMSGAVAEEHRPFRLYAYGLLLLLQLILLPVRGWSQSLRIVGTPVAGVLIWFCVSIVWADHFTLASRRTFLVCLIYFGVLSAVADLGYQRSLAVFRLLLVIALALNFTVVLAFPDFGTQPWDTFNLWRGFMAHKNIAGMICAMTILAFSFDAAKILESFSGEEPLRLQSDTGFSHRLER